MTPDPNIGENCAGCRRWIPSFVTNCSSCGCRASWAPISVINLARFFGFGDGEWGSGAKGTRGLRPNASKDGGLATRYAAAAAARREQG